MNVGGDQICVVKMVEGWRLGAGIKDNFQNSQHGWKVRLFTELRTTEGKLRPGAAETMSFKNLLQGPPRHGTAGTG